MSTPKILKADEDPAYCGYCDYHADSHDYYDRNDSPNVPCAECRGGACVRVQQVPGGWIEEPRLKDEDHYLTNPVWCGDQTPERYMGYPWGLGGECWWVAVYEADPERPGQWAYRKVFAAVDKEDALAGARAWAAAGFPEYHNQQAKRQ